MLVLHAALQQDHLLLWAESNDAREGIREALDRAGVQVAGESRRAEALLPPGPSTPLLGERPKARGKAKPKPTTVDTIRVGAPEAIALLTRAAGERVLAPAVLVGTDLAWCAIAMRYAAALVARGH